MTTTAVDSEPTREGRPGIRPDRLRAAAKAAVLLFVLYRLLQLVWPTPAGIVVQGVIVGSLTALISFGLALIYRANRVVNFAQADLGVVPAMVGVTLMTRTRIEGLQQVDKSWPYLVCILLSLALAVLLGMFVERVFIRRFSKAPRLILMVVTIGLAQILTGFGGTIPLMLSDQSLTARPYPSPFDFTFEVGSVALGGNEIIALAVASTAIVALLAFLRFTNVGIAIRASAESADRASLLGVNVGVTQNVAWVVATLLSTVAMLLRAGILGLPSGSAFGPTILLRALAATVIGRMERFSVMLAAACGLGIVETAIIWNEGSATLVDPVLFLIVIVTLLVQRRRRESRLDEQATSSWQEAASVRPIPRELAGLPEVRWGLRVLGALGVLFVVALPLVLDDGKTNLASAVFIYAMIGLSMVLLTGWGGEMSLGQVAFVGIGAAVGGALNVHYGWDLTLTTLAAGVVGAAASIVIGLPALRIRGLFLAVSTMAFALATSSYLLNEKFFAYLPDNITERVQRFPLFGRLDIAAETPFYYVCLAVLVIVMWSLRGIQRSRMGRVLIAGRDNDRAARSFGVSPTRVKLTAFAMSGFYASLAGGLFAVHQQAVGQEVFAPIESVRALTMVVVGGLGSVPGALLGAVFVKSTEWFNTSVPRDYRVLVTFAGSGVGLLLVLWFLPGGLGSVLYRARDALLKVVANRRGILVPALVADAAEELAVLGGADGRGRIAQERRWRRLRPDEPFDGPQFLRWLPRRSPPMLDYFTYPDLALGGGRTNILSIRSLDVAYGQVQVLFGVNAEVARGEVVALLGTNGAGKSTVLRAASGLVAPRRGSISFEGIDVAGMAPHRVAALGLIQVPGGRGIFPSLTVAENMKLAGWMFRRDHEYVRSTQAEVLDVFPVLQRKLDQPAANLSGGEQQMLTLAMALIAKPKLLMIDELSLGLAPVVVEELLKVVGRLVEAGTTVILVEQSVNVALTLADRAFFMEKGEVRFRGPTAELLERPDVLRSAFLEGVAGRIPATPVAKGAQADPLAERPHENGPARRLRAAARPVGPVVLRAEGLTKRFAGVTAVSEVSLSLHEREIVGIIGPNGAGKTTLFDLLSGFILPDAGRVTFEGIDITSTRPEVRSRFGVARSYQDARLFGGLTVHQTVAVALDRRLEVRDPLAAALNLPAVLEAERRLGDEADELIEVMRLHAFRDKFIAELSTGSRRIVDLACQIGLEPRVILFDEPSSGIAQREAEALGPLLLRIRERTGASLLVIEHDMPLLSSISDRMVALDLGAVVVDGPAELVLNDPQVVASYLGSRRDVIERSGARGPVAVGTRA